MAYTKDQIIDTLKKAVGGTTYGDDLIKRIETTPLAHVYLEDHLEEVIGVLKAYVRIYESSSEEVKETPIDEKIALIEKALKAVEEL